MMVFRTTHTNATFRWNNLTRKGEQMSKDKSTTADSNSSTQSWSYSAAVALFPTHGCSEIACEFHLPPDCAGHSGVFCCALNLSDALMRVGYALPASTDVNYCDHGRVRNADGMARICRKQNSGAIDASSWSNRPSWKGIVYFEGGEVTQHIDFWDGASAVHTQYPSANVIWFWKLGS